MSQPGLSFAVVVDTHPRRLEKAGTHAGLRKIGLPDQRAGRMRTR